MVTVSQHVSTRRERITLVIKNFVQELDLKNETTCKRCIRFNYLTKSMECEIAVLIYLYSYASISTFLFALKYLATNTF